MASLAAELANRAGLSLVKAKGPFGGPTGEGCAVGSIDGFPVVAGLTKVGNNKAVLLLVRMVGGSLTLSPEQLRARVEHDPQLLAAMDKKELSGAERKASTFAGDGVLLTWFYRFRAPGADKVADGLRALVAAVKTVARPPERDCEACGQRDGDLYLSNGNYVQRLCTADLQRAQAGDDARIAAYRALVSRPLVGLLFGSVIAVGAAALWAGIAIAIHRIFFLVAVLIGAAIGVAVKRGSGKIDRAGQVTTLILTFVAVILGQFAYVVVTASQALKIPITPQLAQVVAERFVSIEFGSSNGYFVLGAAIVGAVLTLGYFRAPVSKREFVRVDAAAS